MPECGLETMGSSRVEGGDAPAKSWRVVGLRTGHGLDAVPLPRLLAVRNTHASPKCVEIFVGCRRSGIGVLTLFERGKFRFKKRLFGRGAACVPKGIASSSTSYKTFSAKECQANDESITFRC